MTNMVRDEYGEFRCDWCDHRCLYKVIPFDHGTHRYHFCTYHCQWLWAHSVGAPRLADFRNRTRRED